jgi:NHLM bacteriocin system ABC transporter ATP-binding protein
MNDRYHRPSPDRLAELGTAGTRRELSARADRDIFFIQQGHADVFLARHAGQHDEGAHDYFLSVSAGHLFSLPLIDDDDFGFIAVVAPNTHYRAIPRERLLHELQISACDEAAALIDKFVASVTTNMLDKAPASCALLAAGASFVTAEESAGLVPEPGVMWLEMLAGQARYFGRVPIELGRLALWSTEVWVSVAPHSEVVASTTKQVFMRGLCVDMLAAIDTKMSMLGQEAIRHKQQEDLTELARLQAKSEIGDKTMSDALLEFAEIFEGNRHGISNNNDNDPLLAACRMIGGSQGIKFRRPAAAGKTTVRGIVQASRVRHRVVALKGDWWMQDGGPILAFSQPDKTPVALMPVKGGGYRAVNPITGDSTVVTSCCADSWMPFAVMFYATLPSKRLTLSDIARFSLHGVRAEIGIVAAIALASTVLSMVIPIASGHLFDSVFPAADRRQMVQVVAILFSVSLATLLLETTRSLAMLRIEGRASSNLQAAVWDRVLSLPAPFFRNFTAGDLATRINGINQIREILSGTMISTLISGIFSVLTVFVLFYYSVKLALVSVGLVAVAVLFNAVVGYFGVRATRETAHLNGKVTGMVFEYLSGITKLRITGAEHGAFANWAAKFASQKRVALRAGSLNNLATVFGAAFPVISSTVIFFCISLVPSREVSAFSTGDFIAFGASFTIFLGAALSLVRIGLDFVSVVSIFDRTRPIFEAIPETDEDKASPGVLEGDLELSNVCFSYSPDHPPILQGISIRARPGEFVALVGSSGSGKSTLLRLMLGFERSSQGCIYYDGHDLADLEVREVRQQIGVVLQSGKLMSGDIYTNIIGSTSMSIDHAWDAARACGLDADINAMPMGMHTVVSDGGGTLSGGQRQRLLIARAIVNKPRIIFFDEATSALDNRSQAIVSASMKQLKATRIVIAHRLSTIINADRIYVLNKGMVVQSGTYEQLMNQEGLFVDLAKRQLA